MLADDFKPRNSVKDLLAALFFPVVIAWTVVSHVIDVYFLGGRFEKRASDRLRQQFAKEIQESVPSLFSDFGARVVPNLEEYSPAFDYAAVTVTVDGILLLFIRGRGEFKVEVTPPEKPTAWREVATVVRNSDLPGNPDRKVNYYGLADFGPFFQANFDIIRHEVSKPGWRPPARWLIPIT